MEDRSEQTEAFARMLELEDRTQVMRGVDLLFDRGWPSNHFTVGMAARAGAGLVPLVYEGSRSEAKYKALMDAEDARKMEPKWLRSFRASVRTSASQRWQGAERVRYHRDLWLLDGLKQKRTAKSKSSGEGGWHLNSPRKSPFVRMIPKRCSVTYEKKLSLAFSFTRPICCAAT